jgi:hypothetical protein
MLIAFVVALVFMLGLQWSVRKVVSWYRVRRFRKIVLEQFGGDMEAAQVVIQDALYLGLAELFNAQEMNAMVFDLRQRMGAIHSNPVVENNKKENHGRQAAG